tara:strand:- start:3227 stop:3898 length:672 start_codon:yes stop_codon:yes gene_type:complete
MISNKKKIISHFFDHNKMPVVNYYEYPFEHLVVDNCFSPELIKKVLKNLKLKERLFNKKVMGGRFIIRNDKEDFKKIINDKNSTLKLYKYLKNSKNFNKLKMYFQKSIPKVKKNNLKFYFDYSIGKKGYFREPHRDSDSRVIIFLGYFNKTNEGSLNLYKYKNDYKKIYERRPKMDKIELAKKIEIKSNRFIFFPNSPNSYHAVSKIKSDKIKRYFCYGSYCV